MKINSVGIIGLGKFGKFVASRIPPGVKIVGFDEKTTDNSLAEAATCDVVVLAIPLGQYQSLLSKLKPILPKETLLIDVCSVKVLPERLIEKHLGNHENLLLTHPLFGPQSATHGLAGHKLIITGSKGQRAKQVIAFCEDILQLQVSHMTSQEHDKIMADVHALTFFVARGLADAHVERGSFITPSYKMIVDLVDFDRSHSDELFETIELGNPYAEAARLKLLQSFEAVNQDLSNKKRDDYVTD